MTAKLKTTYGNAENWTISLKSECRLSVFALDPFAPLASGSFPSFAKENSTAGGLQTFAALPRIY
jgi:hypothetical protein